MIGCMLEVSVMTRAAAHLAELADFLHLEGNLLIASDLFEGALDRGALSFATDGKKLGVQVRPR